MSNFLVVFFPVLMVIGAVGSMIVNIVRNGFLDAMTLQWLGAGLLYTALTLRNIGH